MPDSPENNKEPTHMNTTPLAMLFAALALAAPAQLLQDFAPSASSGMENSESSPGKATAARRKGNIGSGELKLTGRYMSANRQTGELTASGGVSAVSGVYRFFGEDVRRDQVSLIDFGPNPMMTTCSNDTEHLHWRLSGKAPAEWLPSGSFSYQDTAYTNSEGEVIHRALKLRNMWAYWYDIPVLWVPFWYYPFDTNYGWRFLPGYTSRWGGYILSGSVYNIINEGDPDFEIRQIEEHTFTANSVSVSANDTYVFLTFTGTEESRLYERNRETGEYLMHSGYPFTRNCDFLLTFAY